MQQNSAFQKFKALKTGCNKRYRYNKFLAEEVRSLNEAVKNNRKIKYFLYDKNSLPDCSRDMLQNVRTEMEYCLALVCGKNELRRGVTEAEALMMKYILKAQ